MKNLDFLKIGNFDNIRIFSLILILSVITSKSSAQTFFVPSNCNLYSYVNLFYDTANFNEKDTTEGGENNQLIRSCQIWGPRLYPHGNFSIARNAILNYTKNYSYYPSSYNPNWQCLGPSDTPEGANTSKGVGQIHRITFDPNYDGNNNKTIYATSGFGGLWRTENDGELWANLNTDEQLPISSVADVAVNYSNPNMIFIATGVGDEGILHTYSPNWANTNPIFTFGLYRSTDHGLTWLPINNGFIQDFEAYGGTIRRLISNKYNPHILLAATSLGIYRCNDADANVPHWTRVYQGTNSNIFDFRSVEWKPGSDLVAYAAGCDNIYKTSDAGLTWFPITGVATGLDLLQLTGFTPLVINLAVTPANTGKLYAYIFGTSDQLVNNTYSQMYLYEFVNNHWQQITTQHDYLAKEWLGIAASPIFEDEIYFYGAWGIYARLHDSTTITRMTDYMGTGFHPDVHVLIFQPNVQVPLLFNGNHGGISVKQGLEIRKNEGWEYRNKGLQNQLIWEFDDSEFSKRRYTIANQDCGVSIYDENQNSWKTISGGDGITVKIMKTNPDLLFYNRLSQYDFLNNVITYEFIYRPIDPATNLRDGWFGHKNAMFRLPLQDKTYFASLEIYKRLRDYSIPDDEYHPENLWQVNSDIGKTEPIQWKRQITKVSVCEGNPNYAYIVTGGVFVNDPSNPMQISSRLYKTQSGFNEGDFSIDKFQEISYPGLGNDIFPIISGVAVHPINPEKVWLSFIEYDLPMQVVFSSDGGITWEDADPNKTLPNLPINCIVVQIGQNEDIVYVGTDVGVYVCKDHLNWEKYGSFPNVRVTELKINYCNNKLRASTYGRSLWEGDLLPYQLPTINVLSGQNIIWNDKMYLTSNIVLESNSTLTIKNLVNVPANAKIIVKQNAKLIVDGGTLTNGCGFQWQGIEVWGNSNQHQYTIGGACAQGTIELKNGAIIEDAITGITTFNPYDNTTTGGIIKATNTDFINCANGVEFVKYRNFSPANGAETDNVSYFNNCRFIVNDSYSVSGIAFNSGAKLWSVKGVKFNGCDFLNNRSVKGQGFGIQALDAGIRVAELCNQPVIPCPENQIDKSNFVGFEYGISAYNTESIYSIYVVNSVFNDNGYGIDMHSVNNAVILKNTFTLATATNCPNYGYGLNMYDCSGYAIEDNYFQRNGTSSTDNFSGIEVSNSGPEYNEIYRNHFTNLTVGNLAEGQNATEMLPLSGLTYLCNQNTGNKYDFYVTNNPTFPSWISSYQKGPNNTSAANIFSPTADIHFNNGGLYGVRYYHTSGLQPQRTVNVKNILTTNTNGCPDHYSGNGGVSSLKLSPNQIIALETEFAGAYSAYNSVDALYNSLKDGGSTENTVTDINTSGPEDMWALRAKLLGDSPHLSQVALKEAALKTEVLPQSILFEILSANPDELRNEDFLSFLGTKEYPLPQYMIELLRSISGNTSYKTILQEQLNNYENIKKSIASEILRSYLHDSITDNTAIINWLDNKGGLNSQYELVDFYLQSGNTGAALAILSLIPVYNQFTSSDSLEFIQVQTLKSLLISIKNDNRNIMQLTTPEVIQLQKIAGSGKNIASVQASGILEFMKGIPACNCIRYNDSIKHSEITTSAGAIPPSEIVITTAPNPATNWIAFNYLLPESNPKITISITDNTGRLIKQIELAGKSGQKVLDTRQLAVGTYLYFCNETKQINGKFIVTR